MAVRVRVGCPMPASGPVATRAFSHRFAVCPLGRGQRPRAKPLHRPSSATTMLCRTPIVDREQEFGTFATPRLIATLSRIATLSQIATLSRIATLSNGIHRAKMNDCHLNVDLSTVCRICLSDEPCTPVLSPTNAKIADVVYSVYRIRITDIDQKSKMMCENCMKPIQRVNDMRKMAKNTQRNLCFKIKEIYGEDVENFKRVLKLKKIEELEINKTKIDEPKMKNLEFDKPKHKKPEIKKLKIKEPKIKKPKMENVKFDNPKYNELETDEQKMDLMLPTKEPKTEGLKTVVPKIGFIPSKKIVIKNENGYLVCQYCSIFSDSVYEHVTHLREKHKLQMELKNKKIQLCPLCDYNYEIKNYLKHIEYCTNFMKMDDGFLCGSCNVNFKNVSSNQFRKHYIFCKSFQKIDDDGTQRYKCYNCTFESSDLNLCMTHASSTCLYLRMNLKYARRPGESHELIRLKRLDEIIQSLSVPVIKPLSNTESVVCFDTSRLKFLNFLHYNCFNCKGVFVNELQFHEHTVNGVKCRIKKTWFCKMCMTDFEDGNDYSDHLLAKIPCYERHLAEPIYNGLCSIKSE